MPGRLFFERSVLVLEFQLVQCMPDQESDFFQRERLFDVVVGPELDRLDCGLDRAMTRHHDDLKMRNALQRAPKRFDPVHFGHPDIEKDQIRRLGFDEFEGF